MNMELIDYGNELNGELQLLDSMMELIDKCFNELNKVMQERKDIIEKELKMAQKWGSDINVSDTTFSITEYGKRIVENEREELKRTIKENWKRVIANELGNMKPSEVSNEAPIKIQQFINDFTTELKEDLNRAKTNLLDLLERARCIKFYKRFY